MCFQTACFKYQKMEKTPPLKKNPCPPMRYPSVLANMSRLEKSLSTFKKKEQKNVSGRTLKSLEN